MRQESKGGGKLARFSSRTAPPETEGGSAPVPCWPQLGMGRRSRPGQQLHRIRAPGPVPTPRMTKSGGKKIDPYAVLFLPYGR